MSYSDAINRVNRGVSGFAAEMREKGIDVGLGKPGRCVTCGEAWPCASTAPTEGTPERNQP